jgi:ABC-2 type transport system ATP-binding protein
MKNLVCENIVKIYSNKKVLDGVDLTIEPNKIYGLIGRNGAGKTTLLSILTAQNTSNQGSVNYGGQKLWENQEALNDICFSREINPITMSGNNMMKVKEYIKLAQLYYVHWDNDYANRLIELFGLDLKKKMHKLSKGMLSMLTIIVAMASRAKITILDEPVAGLDIFMREKFYNLLLEDYTETGRTFIISTHIIEEAAAIFEEVIILNDGKVVVKENTQKLLESYKLVSGHEEVINKISPNFEVIDTQSIGRSKTICVKLKDNHDINAITAGCDVDVLPVSLQKLVIHLIGDHKGEK